MHDMLSDAENQMHSIDNCKSIVFIDKFILSNYMGNLEKQVVIIKYPPNAPWDRASHPLHGLERFEV